MVLRTPQLRKSVAAILAVACLALGVGYPQWSYALFELGYYRQGTAAAALADAWQRIADRLRRIQSECANLKPRSPEFAFCTAATSAAGAYANGLAQEYLAVANDPPDPDFAVVEGPEIHYLLLDRTPGIAKASTAAWNALLTNDARTVGLLDAFVTSNERAQGAALANADGWKQIQAQLAALYASELGRLAEAQPALAGDAIASWYHEGLPALQSAAPTFPDFLAAPGLVQKTSDFSSAMKALADDNLVRVEILINSDDSPGINPDSKQKVKVAVLGSVSLDATQVDPASLRFGPGLASPVGNPPKYPDVDKDGKNDLVVRFAVQDTAVDCKDGVVTLIGSTFDGRAIGGLAYIDTVGCGK